MTKEIFEWIKTIAVSIVIALFITTFIARPTLVKQHSMYPTLNPNDYLILNKISYRFHEPQKGDIVVFKTALKTAQGKEKNLIKRVIGVEGDEVVVKDGKVYVNGEELVEDYINGDYTPGDVKITVPDNHVFVMGDNRSQSLDSRQLGTFSIDNIQGKVLVRLFPLNRIGRVD
ncbi:signal peptidase I [Paramaledivibacter caminithermalis]|jgi:signal peptidase I|uniref:Signal peptidase I n=1 Tax=Paramaledivibacter caminithermalis (strain DSM 15212 / CIP 107654 / DViRD3) TaxID=1121301 RepID=A0A1M6LH65_PARC5|nr:signal peptidase I [Paramaledivibacter caminithermalis]SHJ70544.1 signal peptidase I [Paramaledivibacter caminithermalis DSM 15212]